MFRGLLALPEVKAGRSKHALGMCYASGLCQRDMHSVVLIGAIMPAPDDLRTMLQKQPTHMQSVYGQTQHYGLSRQEADVSDSTYTATARGNP
jgi:hypothetical protein